MRCDLVINCELVTLWTIVCTIGSFENFWVLSKTSNQLKAIMSCKLSLGANTWWYRIFLQLFIFWQNRMRKFMIRFLTSDSFQVASEAMHLVLISLMLFLVALIVRTNLLEFLCKLTDNFHFYIRECFKHCFFLGMNGPDLV